jgi:CHASE3 domain sensor protein
MKWSIGMKIGGGFALALAMLTVVGGVSYYSTIKLVDSAEWVQHTHEVLNTLDEALSAVKDGETGQRGYIITGEARYLEPFQGARDVVDQKVRHLRELTADNPIQQQRLVALEPLVSSKFAELQETIDLRKEKGFGPAEQAVVSDRGKTGMDSIRKLVTEMQAGETVLLARRSLEANDRAHSTQMTILVGGLCSFVLLKPGRCAPYPKHRRSAW